MFMGFALVRPGEVEKLLLRAGEGLPRPALLLGQYERDGEVRKFLRLADDPLFVNVLDLHVSQPHQGRSQRHLVEALMVVAVLAWTSMRRGIAIGRILPQKDRDFFFVASFIIASFASFVTGSLVAIPGVRGEVKRIWRRGCIM